MFTNVHFDIGKVLSVNEALQMFGEALLLGLQPEPSSQEPSSQETEE